MSTTTTIRLPEDSKARIASAAEHTGKTTHIFILEAIAEKLEIEEQRASFDAEANARFAKIVETGKTILGPTCAIPGKSGGGETTAAPDCQVKMYDMARVSSPNDEYVRNEFERQ